MNIRSGTVGIYYKGGFEPNMSRREAHLILGLKENSNASEVKQRYKKMMMANHPDSGMHSFIQVAQLI